MMVSYKYRKKCGICKEIFECRHETRVFCDDCRTRMGKDKKKKKMVRQMKKKSKVKLMNNNPVGYNKHNKNPIPVVMTKNQLEKFVQKSDIDQKQIIGELGNELYMLKKEIRPLLLKFTKFKEYYERKHFGWDWDDK